MAKLPTRTLDLADVRIAYTEYGEGPALLLFHGNSESKAIFSRHQQVNFKDFHTFALDSRGHGETVSNDSKYTIEQYADDAVAFCAARGISRAYVLGYSDGGNIALFLAKKAPGTFPKLAALSPNYLASGTQDGTLRLFRAAYRVLQVLGKLGLPTHKTLLRMDLMLTDIGISAGELAGIHTSMRILYAEHDLIKEEHIREIAGLIPGATLKQIAKCNHLTILDQPATIEDLRAYFLGASG